jgi:uncharacterized protein (TIGR00297 family)
MRILLLDFPGLMSSLAIGAIVLFFSGELWIKNFILLCSFLVLGVTVTRWRHEEKRERGLYEHERGWKNVISNGSVPALCCIAYYFNPSMAWIAAYIGSLAAATADKFASELGVLAGKPINLRNLKPAKPGTSGAVSVLGTWMSFIGALLMALIAYYLFEFDPGYIFIIAIIGFIGGFIDTIAGIFEEMGFGTKSTSNIICTIVGLVLGYFFVVL